MKKTKRTFIAFAVFSTSLVFASAVAQASECESYTQHVSSVSPRSMTISANQVLPAEMQTLWDVVAQSPRHAIPLLGRIVAAGQPAIGECKYPGMGLAVGAGSGPSERSVTFWFWADEVNLADARTSLLAFMSGVITTTTTSTTTTTLPPTTTTTTTVPAPEAETQLIAFSSAILLASTAPVATQSTSGSASAVPARIVVPAGIKNKAPARKAAPARKTKKKCKRIVKRVKLKKTGKIVKIKKRVCK